MSDSIEHGKLLIQEFLHVLLFDHVQLNNFDSYCNLDGSLLFSFLGWILETTCVEGAFVDLRCHALAQSLVQEHLDFADFFDRRGRWSHLTLSDLRSRLLT